LAHNIKRKREEEICKIWSDQIRAAQKRKERYRRNAVQAEKYYAGPNHDFLYESSPVAAPDFKVTINKVYEMVSIFGPMIYAQNPTRLVTRKPAGNPFIAEAMNKYLNYTPKEFGLKAMSKGSLDEALIHGRGVTITGPDRRTGLVKTTRVHDKDILVDPAEPIWYNGLYILRLRRNVPLWKIAERFGDATAKRFQGGATETGSMGLRGEGADIWEGDGVGEYGARRDNQNLDNAQNKRVYDYAGPRITYVEVYSKMGLGMRSSDESDAQTQLGNAPDDQADNVAFAYEPSRNIILNQPGPWPIPYWADHGKHSWPFAFVDPAENQDKTWPISLITPALGLQKFIDWGWSFALAGIKKSVRNISVCGDDLDSKIIAALKGNGSDVIIPTDKNAEQRKDLIQQVVLAQLNPNLLPMLQEAEILFEKNTGLYEILYGQSSRQIRSATEATVKAEFSRLRIDDIIDRVEDWHDEIARKEALGARFLIDGETMVPIMGPELAMAWDVYRPGDFQAAIAEYDYTVRAGSMRKRTPQYRAEFAEKMLMVVGDKALAIGDLEGYNQVQAEWLNANGIPDAERYNLQAVPPPENQGGGGQEAPAPVAPEIQRGQCERARWASGDH
jgi:hypothetical protein